MRSRSPTRTPAGRSGPRGRSCDSAPFRSAVATRLERGSQTELDAAWGDNDQRFSEVWIRVMRETRGACVVDLDDILAVEEVEHLERRFESHGTDRDGSRDPQVHIEEIRELSAVTRHAFGSIGKAVAIPVAIPAFEDVERAP